MPNITPLAFDTYQAVVRNAVGSHMFRTLYADVSGVKTDIAENGNLSCAFFVSSVLTMLGMAKAVHATVSGTVADLMGSGWIAAEAPEAGDVIVWETVDFGTGSPHGHIGFYVGDGRAVSNDFKAGSPAEHEWTFGGTRKVEMILRNPAVRPNM